MSIIPDTTKQLYALHMPSPAAHHILHAKGVKILGQEFAEQEGARVDVIKGQLVA